MAKAAAATDLILLNYSQKENQNLSVEFSNKLDSDSENKINGK